jgi:hypothetical protein
LKKICCAYFAIYFSITKKTKTKKYSKKQQRKMSKNRGLKNTINLEASRQKREDVAVKIRKDKQQAALTEARKLPKHNIENNNSNNNNNNNAFNTSFLISDADNESMQWELQTRQGIKNTCDQIKLITGMALNVDMKKHPMSADVMTRLAGLFTGLEAQLCQGGQTAEHELMKQDLAASIVTCFLISNPTYELLISFLDIIQTMTAGDMGEVAEFMKYPIIGFLISLIDVKMEVINAYEQEPLAMYMNVSATIMHILANMCLESSEGRDRIITHNAFSVCTERFAGLINNQFFQETACGYSRLIGSVLRIKPCPDLKMMMDVYTIGKTFMNSSNDETFEEYMSILFNIMASDDENAHMAVINDPDFDAQLTRILQVSLNPSEFNRSRQYAIRRYALMVIAQMMLTCGTINDLVVDKFVNAGVISTMMELIGTTLERIDADALYLILIVANKDLQRITKIIDSGFFTDAFLKRFKNIDYFDIEKNLISLLCDMINCVSDEQLFGVFAGSDIVTRKLVDCIAVPSAEIQQTALGCVRELLVVGNKLALTDAEGSNKIKENLEKKDLPRMLMTCEEKCKNASTSAMAAEIMNDFFETYERTDTLQEEGVASYKFQSMFDEDKSMEDFNKLKTQIFADIGKMYTSKLESMHDNSNNDTDMKN